MHCEYCGDIVKYLTFIAVVFNLFCNIVPLQAICLKIATLPIIFLKIVFCFENNSELMKYKRAI